MTAAGKALAPDTRSALMRNEVVIELTASRHALIWRRHPGAHPLSPFAAYHQGRMTANADKVVRPTSPAGAATG
jgi:hypothetical protein